MRSPAFVLLLLLGTLPACFIGRNSQNEPIREVDISALRPGTMTAREVVELLGAPVDVVQLYKRSAYLYRYTVQKSTGILIVVVGLYNEDQRDDRLWVFFDENNVLTHYGASRQAADTRYAAPWTDLHKPAEEAAPEETGPEEPEAADPEAADPEPGKTEPGAGE